MPNPTPAQLELLKDRIGVPIPQVFDPNRGEFLPLVGDTDGMGVTIKGIAVPAGQSLPLTLTEPIVREVFTLEATGTDGTNGETVYEFAEPMTFFGISNDAEFQPDGSTDLRFTVGALTITVKGGESFGESFAPFNRVTIVAAGTCRAYGKR